MVLVRDRLRVRARVRVRVRVTVRVIANPFPHQLACELLAHAGGSVLVGDRQLHHPSLQLGSAGTLTFNHSPNPVVLTLP